MALALADMKIMYPEYMSTLQNGKEGGYPTVNVFQETEVDKISVFNLALLYTGTYVQYKKIFIKNTGDETALNVSIYGYNLNSNSIVTMALERGQDQEIVYSGQEIIRDTATKPDLYVTSYSFQEILDIAPLTIPNIPAGQSVGVWLRMQFSSIDAFNENDSFILGLNFQGIAAVPFNMEKTIVHSRYDAGVNIIRISRTNSVFKGVIVEFEPIDMSNSGIEMSETVYALYLDRIFFREHVGTNRIPVQLYGMDVPITIEVFALPYGGYRPTMNDLPSSDKNRLKISWLGRNPDTYDVTRHNIYWDNGTGTIIDVPIAVIDAASGVGGGNKVDVAQITN